MVKLSDIALEAGVSVTTVSMALSGKGRISTEIRQKVQKSADKLGYVKKKRCSSESVWAVLVPMSEQWDSIWHFIRPVIDNITKTAVRNGIGCCIIPVYPEFTVSDVKSSLHHHKAASVFSIHFGNTELFESLEKEGIPVVVINNSQYQEGYFSICVDDFQGAYEGTKHIINKKHTAIAFLDYPRPMLPNLASDRYFGFLKAIEEENIQFKEEWKIQIDLDDITELKNRLKKMLEKTPAPTAFFVHDDFMANRLIFILNELGLSVPEDISITAPGDTLNYSFPETARITTMSINTGLMGKYAADMMLERESGGYQESHVLKIKQQLIIRGSTLTRD